ncbi:hypothetical protein [Croceicoccus sp. YJ47]|uniref:hypothetical protein n=1 Tax=Croceicoccus sp. YJ47 TaxID=2798724 RepID=UPI001921D146|nr:hypothetical protein [Croceicoccus sp. YJ47]QQN73163.1 hypothetical protein JD971_09810 [Croceicoccus sp. YJ47]
MFRTANGRIFRLDGENGMIRPEQFGAIGGIARGLAAGNSQPAMKALVRYANAAGIGQMGMTHPYYQSWAPYRISDPADQFAEDGIHLVHTRPISIVSLCGGTTIDYRTHNGGDPRTDWQVVNGKIWRGVAHQLVRKLEEPEDPSEYASLHLHDMHLMGGTNYTGQGFWPADPVTGDGWDNQSHKCIQMQPDGFNKGEVRMTGTSSIVGWRGECVYLASGSTGTFIGNIRIAETNGQCINPNDVQRLVVDGNVVLENAYFSIEGKGGEGSRVRCTIRNTKGGHLQGGGFNFDTQNKNFWPASYRPGEEPPMMDVDIKLIDSRIAVQSYVRGQIDAIDSAVTVDTTAISVIDGQRVAPADAQTIDVTLNAWADRSSDNIPLTLLGNDDDELGTGHKGIHDARFVVNCYRTAYAIETGKYFAACVQYGGSIGERVIIEHGGGESLAGVSLAPASTVRDYHPLFRGNRFRSTQASISLPSVNLQSDSFFPIIGDAMSVRSRAPADPEIRIAGPVAFVVNASGVQEGQELTLHNFEADAYPMLVDVRHDDSPARAVIPPGQSLKLVARDIQGMRWIVDTAPPALSGSVAIDLGAQTIAAGAVTDVHTIPVAGANARLRAEVFAAALPAEFEIIQVQAVNDAVRFRLRNISAAAAAGPNLTFRATTKGQEQ